MSEAEHFATVRDMQITIDELRADRDRWRSIADDLFHYFVDQTGHSQAVKTYIEARHA